MALTKWKISLALLLAALPASFALHLAQGSGRATELIRFVPRLPGHGMLSGYCWTGSIAVDRPDAWRCMAGNGIFDPCFTGKDKGFVVCDPDPAKSDPGMRMKLTRPLPVPDAQTAPAAKAGAWLVELADGSTCRKRTGAGWEIQGLIVNYYCEGGKKGVEIDLVGDLDTSGPLWTVRKATIFEGEKGPGRIKEEKAVIKRVWR
ncbi:MAG: hypothetical protein P4L43_02575 [Syntrophobacteraceae bacterium]|nr:hypothetical protein [Syntrophobacteraceae bacterium]